MKPRLNIEIGQEYGWLTVLGEAERDKFGHYRYWVKCRCGKEFIVLPTNLGKRNKCADCSRKNIKCRTDDIVGKTINGWEVLKQEGKGKKGYTFLCRCQKCGSLSLKSKSEVVCSHGAGCKFCTPDYHFSYKSDGAYGTLPDGTEFIVDAEDSDKVSERYWHYNANKGYVISAEHQMEHLRLHRFLLGITDEKIIVDHINRNKRDCRKSNLRIVTAQQNSMNCSMRPNATGFKGVSFVKSRNIYRAQIGINNRDISLGQSKDPVVCAQMYNIAARMLFGDYLGYTNDVPKPSAELIEKIKLKCQPYIDEAYQATRKCGLSFCMEV